MNQSQQILNRLKNQEQNQNQNSMENKSIIIKVILGIVAFLVLAFFNPLSYNDAGERTVVEQFDGKQFVQYAPGVYYAGFFAKERPWPNQISVSYQADAPDMDLKDGTIEIGKQTIRFGGDATSANISGIVQYILPMDEKEMIDMHNAHRTPQSLVQKRLAPYTKECLQSSAQLMSSEAHYSGGRAQMAQDFSDQLKNGVFILKTVDKVIYDSLEKENKRVLDQFFKKTTKLQDKNQFNQWFNKEFERNRIKTEEEELGYGDWLKSNENMDDIFTQNLPHNQLKDALDRKKAEMRTLTLRPEIQEVNSGRPPFGTNLIGGGMDYGSGLFDSLQYEDLKTAYTQTLIPVTEEDYDNRQKFHSVNELQSFRGSQDTQPLSEQQAMEYLNRRNKIEEEESVRRAYELMKQTEESEKKNAEFLQKMRLLK
jgi:hypothetical protein